MSDVIQTWLLYLRYRLLSGTLAAGAYALSVAALREELPAILADRLDATARGFLTTFLERCAPFFDEVVSVPLRKAL